MGGTKENCLFTGRQLGIVHESLAMKNTNKYVEPTACLQPPLGMTLWLPFDEAYGTTALNAPGVAGAAIGGPSRVAGKASRARSFNGTPAQYVDVPDYPGSNFSTFDFTLEAWVFPTTVGGKHVIIAKEGVQSGVTRGYAFYVLNGSLGLDLADGTTSTFLSSSALVTPNTWTHVGVTVNRHLATGGVFYINGVPSGTFNPLPRNHSLTNVTPLRIACDTLTTTACFGGALDEVVAYARALTSTELQTIAQAQGAGRCKQYCAAPAVGFAQGQTTVSLNGRICNATDVAREYAYWFFGTPAATCPMTPALDGPPAFSPCTGTIVVPAGTCVSIPTQVPTPPGFGNTGAAICYRLAAQGLGNNDVATLRCAATLNDYFTGPNPH
jgi:hypothetical protein